MPSAAIWEISAWTADRRRPSSTSRWGSTASPSRRRPAIRLTGLTCTDSDANGVPSTGDVASSTATINLDPGETVRCTYTNQPGGSVVIKKAVDSGPSGPFTFLDNIADAGHLRPERRRRAAL